MATATKTKTFTGVVEKAEIEHRKPFGPYIGRYSPHSEYREFYVSVTLRLEDGRAAYFSSPAVMRVVSNCLGAAIVTYTNLDGERANWLKEAGTNRVATSEQPNDNSLRQLVKLGDRITITARVKAEKISRVGNPYLVLNWVRRQPDSWWGRLDQQPEGVHS